MKSRRNHQPRQPYRTYDVLGRPGHPESRGYRQRRYDGEADTMLVVAASSFHAKMLARLEVWMNNPLEPFGILSWRHDSYRILRPFQGRPGGRQYKGTHYQLFDGCTTRSAGSIAVIGPDAAPQTIKYAIRRHLLEHTPVLENLGEKILNDNWYERARQWERQKIMQAFRIPADFQP